MYRASIVAAWISLVLGVAACALLLIGYRTSLPLPTIPRPRIGIGLSASQDVLFGAAFYGWWIAALGVLFAFASILVADRRRFKIMLGAPALVYFLAPICLVAIGELRRAL